MKCILCRKLEADSAEHFYKSSILLKDLAEASENGKIIKVIGLDLKYGSAKKIQGPDSKYLKFDKTICSKCNGSISQDADRLLDKIVLNKTTALTEMSTLIDSFGCPIVMEGSGWDLSTPYTQAVYKMFFNLDVIGIYEYLAYKKIIIFSDKQSLPYMSNQLKTLLDRILNAGLEVKVVKTIPFFGNVLDGIGSSSDFNKLAKYYSKQMICSLFAKEIPIPDGLRSIFFFKEIPKNISVKIYVLKPWMNELPISFTQDHFIDSKGNLVLTLYQELSKSHAFLVYFTFSNLSKNYMKKLYEVELKKKFFNGYIEKYVNKL